MISENSVTVSYHLTEDLWRQFYEAHYAADPSLKMRYFWGALCITIGAFVLVFGSKIVAVLLFLTGFYSVLSRQIFLVKSVAAARKHPFFGKEITAVLTTEGLAVRSGKTGYLQAWENFKGYRNVEAGYMLYLDKNAFFFIPKSACSVEDEKRIDRFLHERMKSRGASK
jgi:hypothetical protein